jgi:hypothetical protein
MQFHKSYLLLLFLSVTALFLMTSCSSKVAFQTSSIIPAARGYVNVKQDRDQNYIIEVKLDYLSEAERLDPPKKTYVIWMESTNNATRNIGQINSSTGFMSNNLKADFQTTSSYKPYCIYITAEDDGTVSYPGPFIVLTTDRLKG